MDGLESWMPDNPLGLKQAQSGVSLRQVLRHRRPAQWLTTSALAAELAPQARQATCSLGHRW